jgi:hypothetical protein
MGQVTTTLCASRRFLPWRETIWTVVGAVAMAGLFSLLDRRLLGE